MENYLEGTIDRIENNVAVIVLSENRGQINWPVENFSTEPVEGTVVKVFIEEDANQTINKETQAKKFLNDIMQN